MSEELVRKDDIVIRRAVEADAQLLRAWISDERVAARYGGRDRAAAEADAITSFDSGDEVLRCIVELAGRPVAYLQIYPVTDAASYGEDDAEGIWATDQFIGLPELWGQGIGPRFVRLAAEHLKANGASRVLTDPAISNTRAVRAYEKAGFVAVKPLPKHETHEGKWLDCVLMEYMG